MLLGMRQANEIGAGVGVHVYVHSYKQTRMRTSGLRLRVHPPSTVQHALTNALKFKHSTRWCNKIIHSVSFHINIIIIISLSRELI